MNGCRKKLIEVALPLEAINRQSAREKSMRHGHLSTLIEVKGRVSGAKMAARVEQNRLQGGALRFPTDRSMGRLLVYPQGGEWTGWWDEGPEARREIAVPEGMEVEPRIQEDGPRDLSPLAGFGPNDLQRLDLSYPRSGRPNLRPVRGLAGLWAINLAATGIADDGLRNLRRIAKLTELNLSDPRVTDIIPPAGRRSPPSGAGAISQRRCRLGSTESPLR